MMEDVVDFNTDVRDVSHSCVISCQEGLQSRLCCKVSTKSE